MTNIFEISEAEIISLLNDLDSFENSDSFPKGFNLFEAIGVRHQEVKHSFFLSFLLNPRECHPFHDSFSKKIIEKIADYSKGKISPLEIKLSDFSDLSIKREWPTREGRRIDLVMYSEHERLVVVVENKRVLGS